MRARVSAKKPTGGPAGPDNSGAPLSSSRVQSVDRAVSLLRAVADAGRVVPRRSRWARPAGSTGPPPGGCSPPWRPTASWSATAPRAAGAWGRDSSTSRARPARRWCSATCTRCSRAWPCRPGRPQRSPWCATGSLTYVDEVFPSRDRVGQLVRAAGEPARDLDGQGAAGLVDRGGAGPADAAAAEALHRRRTITDRAGCAPTSTAARERGYATCHGEFDVSAWGVSAPVLDRTGRLLGGAEHLGSADRGSSRSASRPSAPSPSRPPPRWLLARSLSRGRGWPAWR